MPSSDPAAREFVVKHVVASGGFPDRIIDIGMGAGHYGVVFKSVVPDIEMYGLEIFKNYVGMWNQNDIYNRIFIGDMRDFDYASASADMALAGDVIEHVTKEEAIKVVNTLKKHYKWVIVVIPIVRFEQGPDNEYNNPYEEHKYHWSTEEAVQDLGLNFVGSAGVCGIFEWRCGNV